MIGATAIGVGVAPANFTFEAHVGITNQQSLFVINDGEGIAEYRVYVDDQYVDWFTISPNNFTLEPGEHNEVTIGVKAPLSASGDYDLKAYVIASTPSSNFEVGSGIKIPVHLTVSNDSLFLMLGTVSILLIGIVAAGSRWKKRRKGKMTGQSDKIETADTAVLTPVIENADNQEDLESTVEEDSDSVPEK
ncbi:hypothetical protein [uncultured Methanolobus sp.]|uniref:hypothetical protein n=1 Tax=uncultured Methanolobus sp. TaxID=218300 RepID=UPI002AABB20C|nr:hypothetical protein [uncultured Methanolobus sp.]